MTYCINSIKKLKGIGSFSDFSAPDDLIFKDANLFYGYNGSGKTTLTRVFSCLNDASWTLLDNEGEPLVDFNGGELNIVCNGSNVTDFVRSSLKGKIKVFNADFIEKNLELKVGKAHKLSAVIGEHNATIKKEIERLENAKGAFYDFPDRSDKKLKAQVELEKSEKALENIKKNIAAEIRSYLHIENASSYTIRHFMSDYSSYVPTEEPLTEDNKKAAGDIYLSEVKPEIDSKYVNTLDNILPLLLPDSYTTIFNLLKKPIKRKSTQIKEEVIKWIEEGARLHTDDHNVCKFCGQNIDAETWNARSLQIQELIKKDDAFSELETQITTSKEHISEGIQSLTSFPLELSEQHFFTNELFLEYETAKVAFDTGKTNFLSVLKRLLDRLVEKETNKDSDKSFEDEDNFNNILANFTTAIDRIKSIIAKNNSMVASGDLKEKNKKIVINFYIQQNKPVIEAAELNKTTKQSSLEKAKQDVQKIENDIDAKNASLENQEENLRLINGFLEKMLDIGLIFKIEPNSGEYFLERKMNNMPNRPAKNLSEGEKNIIAFLYFLVSLDSSSAADKKGEIIVIDDPVSSLDSMNLFNIENLTIKTVQKYKQVFFLTHNFYFFAKVREAIKNIYKSQNQEGTESNNNNVAIFEIENMKRKGSNIKYANTCIQNYISEYMSIIDKLKEIYRDPNSEKDVTTGNLIRRVLEVFLSFKKPKGASLFGKFQEMVGNEPKYQYLWTMANSFSHTSEISSITDATDFSYMAGKQEIKDLFEFIKENDEKHFNGCGIKL